MREARFALENGVVLEFKDMSWTGTGRLFCQVIAMAPDGSILGNSKCDLSSDTSRYQVAQGLAAHNGAKPDVWVDALLAAWHSLDEERRDSAEIFDLHSLEQSEEPGPLGYILDPYFPVGHLSNLYGDSQSTKTTTSIGMAVAITRGLPFLGRPTLQGPVLFLDWEMAEDDFLRMVYPICRGMGLDHPPRDLLYSRLTEPLAYHLPDIMEACHRLEPVLVVIDSLGLAAAADPNDAEAFIRIILQLRKLEVACLNIDHQSKGTGQSYGTKRAIGTAYKDFLVRGGIQLELAATVPGRASVVLRHSKHNFRPANEPIAFHIRYGIGVTTFELGEVTEVEFADADSLPLPMRIHKVLLETTQPMEAEVLQEAVGASSKPVLQNAISKLRRSGVKITRSEFQRKTYYQLDETHQPTHQDSPTDET